MGGDRANREKIIRNDECRAEGWGSGGGNFVKPGGGWCKYRAFKPLSISNWCSSKGLLWRRTDRQSPAFSLENVKNKLNTKREDQSSTKTKKPPNHKRSGRRKVRTHKKKKGQNHPGDRGELTISWKKDRRRQKKWGEAT